MICSYCAGVYSSQARHYMIQNVSQRFIPTYYHHPIFNSQHDGRSHQHARCNSAHPGNRGQPAQPCRTGRKVDNRDKTPKSTYVSHFRRSRNQPFRTQRGRNLYNSQSKWYDLGKTDLLRNLDGAQGYSTERKMIDLASSQVFEGLTVAQNNFQPNRKTCHCSCHGCGNGQNELERPRTTQSVQLNPEADQKRQAIKKCLQDKIPEATKITFTKNMQQPKRPQKVIQAPSKTYQTVIKQKK